MKITKDYNDYKIVNINTNIKKYIIEPSRIILIFIFDIVIFEVFILLLLLVVKFFIICGIVKLLIRVLLISNSHAFTIPKYGLIYLFLSPVVLDICHQGEIWFVKKNLIKGVWILKIK